MHIVPCRYNPWVSLVGTFLCVFAMFAMDWLTALVTLAITAGLYLFILYRKPGGGWLGQGRG